MKIFFIVTIILLLISGCGKKSDPKYQSKFNQETLTIS